MGCISVPQGPNSNLSEPLEVSNDFPQIRVSLLARRVHSALRGVRRCSRPQRQQQLSQGSQRKTCEGVKKQEQAGDKTLFFPSKVESNPYHLYQRAMNERHSPLEFKSSAFHTVPFNNLDSHSSLQRS